MPRAIDARCRNEKIPLDGIETGPGCCVVGLGGAAGPCRNEKIPLDGIETGVTAAKATRATKA